MKAAILLVTAPDARSAARISDALVGERLAACVTVVPGARSTYRWKGKIERAREAVLLVKTRAALVRRVERRVRELHPYEVPEILALPVTAGEKRYMKWIEESTKP
ncbi:MAG TPA: divalent-cation tolerance protein CutA [Planctomycetota bacterium]|nr:divalent-cation tolerance protein CutA [Planctomycetota bacterium]